MPRRYTPRTDCLSRPMTGHTPQKLPFFNAISCIIAVFTQSYPPNANAHMIIHAATNVKPFFVFFHKFFHKFLYKTEIFLFSPP